MTRRIIILAACLLIAGVQTIDAAESAARVDAELATPGDIWQGQRVMINVTLKTPGIFASAPAFDLPQVSGMILIPPTGRPLLGTETVGDETFTTQTHELAVFPQQSGILAVPPVTIRFDSSAGFGKPIESREVTTLPVSLTVKRPPGSEQQSLVLTTTDLTLTESWQPQPGKIPATTGAAYTRTIQIAAKNLPALVLPSFHVELPEGLRAYDRDPELNDQDNRGEFSGHRTDILTIVCERPGSYTLPAMSVAWWNPEERELLQAMLPAHQITVAAPAEQESLNSAASQEVAQWPVPWLWIALVILAVAICGAYWFRPALRQWRAAADHSEATAFRRIVSACRAGDPDAAYRAVLTWRHRLEPLTGSHRRDLFAGNRELAGEFQRLEASVFGPPAAQKASAWSPRRLLKTLRQVRAQQMREAADHRQSKMLPELNPSR